MVSQTPVVSISGDYEEVILRYAAHLGTNKIRRKIFDVIYGRGTKPKSPKEIMEKANIPATQSQQVANALNHLSKHHLIAKSKNDGSISDGSVFLYSKVESVRANKDNILKYATNKSAAKSVPTKRNQVVRLTRNSIVKNKASLRKKKKLSVLYLTANPSNDPHEILRVDLEVKSVQQAIRGSIFRDNVKILISPAANLMSIQNGLVDHKPQIVHFSGHSGISGLATDSGANSLPAFDHLGYGLLAKALSAVDNPPKILVLNSCESASEAKKLLVAVDVLIAMNKSISDLAALAFAPRFYAALASGESLLSAFSQGKVAVEGVSINDADTPELFVIAKIDPSQLTMT